MASVRYKLPVGHPVKILLRSFKYIPNIHGGNYGKAWSEKAEGHLYIYEANIYGKFTRH